MAATLTGLFWELAKHVEWQDKIRTELLSISTESVSQWETIHTNVTLDAVIREGLRLHGAVPGSLYREVPSGGRIIAGHFVPEGVINFYTPFILTRNRLLCRCNPIRLIEIRMSFLSRKTLNLHGGFGKM